MAEWKSFKTVLVFIFLWCGISFSGSDTCRKPMTRLAAFPLSVSKPLHIEIESPSKLKEVVIRAVERAEKAAQQRGFQGRYGESYRERLNRELLGTGAVLFLDTPIVDNDQRIINREGVTLVIDHHGPYAPADSLDNTGCQVLKKIRTIVEVNAGKSTSVKIEEFRKFLVGNADRVTFSADNLADAAEVIAVLKNTEIQRRLIERPSLIDVLIESGRHTDFFVFRGDAYEKQNTSEMSRRAILLSKAIMHSYSRLLRGAGVPKGDRIEYLIDVKQQNALLRAAVEVAERLLLEATGPEFTTAKKGEVESLAKEFDRWRGGPGVVETPGGAATSFAVVEKSHDEFLRGLVVDLESALSREQVAKARAAIVRYTYGLISVSTGHQFEDWASISMANDYDSSGARPLTFEIAGEKNSSIGAPVFIGTTGIEKVNLQVLSDGLNEFAKEKLASELREKGGFSSIEMARRLSEKPLEFNLRGTELLYSFGGHSLTRAEVVGVVGDTLALRGKEVVGGF